MACCFLFCENVDCLFLLFGVSVHLCVAQKTCFSVFRREQTSAIKAASFTPIIKIIKMKIKFLDAERLGIREMAEGYPFLMCCLICFCGSFFVI